MPIGPHGEQRPKDVIGCATKVCRIATGEESEVIASAAQQLGRLGGLARSRKLSAKRRSEIARQAAAKRWGQQSE